MTTDKGAPRLDCGWNIPQNVRAEIIEDMMKWKPRDEIGKRDKRICELAFKENMNASQIERLHDPQFVRYSRARKSLGRQLTAKGIIEIIYTHFPQLRKPRGHSVTTEGHRKRIGLWKDANELTENKPKQCAICGSVESLRLHHIVPVDHGGTNDPINLIFLCDACHNELHSRIYKTWGEKGSAGKPIKKGGKPNEENHAAGRTFRQSSFVVAAQRES